MTFRLTLFASAAFLISVPAASQPAQPTSPPASPAAQTAPDEEDTGDEEQIVVTGQRARGSAIGDQWHWNVTGNADVDRNIAWTDRDDPDFPHDRARATTVSGDLTGTANGTVFKLPAGDAGATVSIGASTVQLDTQHRQAGVTTDNSLGRTTGTTKVNFDLPISRKNRDFSALGNLILNANAEARQQAEGPRRGRQRSAELSARPARSARPDGNDQLPQAVLAAAELLPSPVPTGPAKPEPALSEISQIAKLCFSAVQ